MTAIFLLINLLRGLLLLLRGLLLLLRGLLLKLPVGKQRCGLFEQSVIE